GAPTKDDKDMTIGKNYPGTTLKISSPGIDIIKTHGNVRGRDRCESQPQKDRYSRAEATSSSHKGTGAGPRLYTGARAKRRGNVHCLEAPSAHRQSSSPCGPAEEG
ncbi:hypothetical protein C0993_007210, partial [Termitomyces sp. T159_Od127]